MPHQLLRHGTCMHTQDLHAPLVERLFELPMDVHSGALSGELRVYMHNQASWCVPYVDICGCLHAVPSTARAHASKGVQS